MTKETILKIIDEISTAASQTDDLTCQKLIDSILTSNQVFSAGAGRSGELMKCFAKRLMHAELSSYVVGETVSPPAKKGDLLIIGSGSGETESLVIIAKKAKKLGVKLALITTNPKSTLAGLADIILEIKASTPKSTQSKESLSFQPMANLFEQMLYLTTDAISMMVAKEKGLDYTKMFARHANLE